MSTGHGTDSAPAPDDKPRNDIRDDIRDDVRDGIRDHVPDGIRDDPRNDLPSDPPATAATAADGPDGKRHRRTADANRHTPDAKGKPASRPSMFSSLRIRNYRLFAAGQAVSNTGT